MKSANTHFIGKNIKYPEQNHTERLNVLYGYTFTMMLQNFLLILLRVLKVVGKKENRCLALPIDWYEKTAPQQNFHATVDKSCTKCFKPTQPLVQRWLVPAMYTRQVQ